MPGTVFSIIESARHPNFSALYGRLGLAEVRLGSIRKTISTLKKQQPDFIVAEFFYGYSNNYAGVNISNLDVMLFTLQKYAPEARVIILVEKAEHQYVAKLNDIFPLAGVLQYPVSEADLEALLTVDRAAGHQ